MQPVATSPLGGWILIASMVPYPTEREGLPIDLEICRELLPPHPPHFTSFLFGIQMVVVLKRKVGFPDGSVGYLLATPWVLNCD